MYALDIYYKFTFYLRKPFDTGITQFLFPIYGQIDTGKICF